MSKQLAIDQLVIGLKRDLENIVHHSMHAGETILQAYRALNPSDFENLQKRCGFQLEEVYFNLLRYLQVNRNLRTLNISKEDKTSYREVFLKVEAALLELDLSITDMTNLIKLELKGTEN